MWSEKRTFKDAAYCISRQMIRRFAKAGFFFTGKDDHMRCFECGKTLLDNINYDEDIWDQHAFWSPSCNYVIQEKGREYIKNVQKHGEIRNSRYEVHGKEKIGISSISKEINNEILRYAALNVKYVQALYEDQLAIKLCTLCCDEDRTVMFFPCRHLLACPRCSSFLKNCPVCKKEIAMQCNVFIS